MTSWSCSALKCDFPSRGTLKTGEEPCLLFSLLQYPRYGDPEIDGFILPLTVKGVVGVDAADLERLAQEGSLEFSAVVVWVPLSISLRAVLPLTNQSIFS